LRPKHPRNPWEKGFSRIKSTKRIRFLHHEENPNSLRKGSSQNEQKEIKRISLGT